MYSEASLKANGKTLLSNLENICIWYAGARLEKRFANLRCEVAQWAS
jgi:hypothetical protein